MSTSTTNGDQPDALSVHENAQNLLLALHNAEDHRASTSDLREPTGLSAANISGRHAKTLIRKGWAEKVGKEDVGAREDANVYELTHRGKREANLLLKSKPVPMSEEERTLRVQQLQDRVDELEAIVERTAGAQEVPDDLAEQVESNTERLDDFESALERVSGMIETLNGKIEDVRELV